MIKIEHAIETHGNEMLVPELQNGAVDEQLTPEEEKVVLIKETIKQIRQVIIQQAAFPGFETGMERAIHSSKTTSLDSSSFSNPTSNRETKTCAFLLSKRSQKVKIKVFKV